MSLVTVIRPFTPDDYDALAALVYAVDPNDPVSAAELRHRDHSRDPKCKAGRLVATNDGGIVAVGSYGQWASMYHPHKFSLNLAVHPDYRRQGLGSRLYDQLIASLAPFEPIMLRAWTLESRPDALRFLAQRGFVEEDRAWESRLDPQTFDPTPYMHLGDAVRSSGVTFKTLRELMDEPDHQHKLFDLDWALSQDVPTPEPFTKPDEARWISAHFSDPTLLPDGYLVATTGDDYVAISALWQSEDGLGNGLTGVTRGHRRQGIALAMKVHNLMWAKANGYRQIKTWNNTTNRPMLAINERLGFIKQPADINFKKEL